jgi:hypothetical protein
VCSAQKLNDFDNNKLIIIAKIYWNVRIVTHFTYDAKIRIKFVETLRNVKNSKFTDQGLQNTVTVYFVDKNNCML